MPSACCLFFYELANLNKMLLFQEPVLVWMLSDVHLKYLTLLMPSETVRCCVLLERLQTRSLEKCWKNESKEEKKPARRAATVIHCTGRRDKQESQSKESHTACQYMDPNCSYPLTSHSQRREQVHSIAFPAIYLFPIMTVFDSPSAPLCLFRCHFHCALLPAPVL